MKIKDIVIDGSGNNSFGWVATKTWIPMPEFVRESMTQFKLRRQLKDTKIRTWWRFWASAFDKKKFSEDLDALTNFYKDEGHRDFTILSEFV